MIKYSFLVSLLGIIALSGTSLIADEGKPAKEAGERIIKFEKGGWDAAKWTPLRMANQAQAKTFVQMDGGIGTNMQTFNRDDYKAETDNAIMLYDLGTTEAEIAVTFNLGKGFGGYSCPGLCISPQVKDGMAQSSIAVFVADYTMAIWYHTTDTDGKTVRYRHLMQLSRWTDPRKPHTLRCRISKKEASVALKLDDADVVVLSFVGNKTYGSVDQPVNSLIGVWGCHGECTFHAMTIFAEPTLQFVRRTPEKTAK